MHPMQSLNREVLVDEKPTPEVRSGSDVVVNSSYGWVIVASTFIAFSIIPFHLFTFGILSPEFATRFSLSESDIGMIASLRFGLFSLSGVLAGPLVHRFGCRPVAMASVLGCTFGFVATAFATNRFSITISYGLIPGLGAGLMTIPTVVIVQQYFTRRRAIAAAISSVGVGFFALVCSPLTRILVDSFGWRGASLMFGGFSIQMLVPTALYRPPNRHKHISEQQVSTDINCRGMVKQFATYMFKKELFTRYYLLFLVTNTTRTAVVGIYYLRMSLIARSVGIDTLKTAILPSMISALTTVARGLSGFLANYVPPQVMYGVANVLTALVVFVVPLLPNTFPAHATFCTFFGFSLGTVNGIQHSYLATLVGVQILPLALSWGFLFTAIFQIINNLLVGWLLDETGSYRVPLWYGATVHFLGSLSAITIIFLKWKEKKAEIPNKEELPLENLT